MGFWILTLGLSRVLSYLLEVNQTGVYSFTLEVALWELKDHHAHLTSFRPGWSHSNLLRTNPWMEPRICIMKEMCFAPCNYSSTDYFHISLWTQISAVLDGSFGLSLAIPAFPILTAFGPSFQQPITQFTKIRTITHPRYNADLKTHLLNSLHDSIRDWFGDTSDPMWSYFPVPSVNLFMNYVIYFWSILEILQIRDTCTCRNPAGGRVTCLWPSDALRNLSSNLYPSMCVSVQASVASWAL